MSWVIRVEEHLPLVEFTYNNSYRRVYRWHRMRHCMGGHVDHRFFWTEVGESSITGPDLIRDTSKKVSLVR